MFSKKATKLDKIFTIDLRVTKGQLISKCLFGVIVSTKKNNENIVRISALKVFIVSLGLLGSFLGTLVGFFINDITY